MKIIDQTVPWGTRAVRICDDQGTPRFNFLVTPKGWFWKVGWVWLGMGTMDYKVKNAVRDYVVKMGCNFIQWERLEFDGLRGVCYPLKKPLSKKQIKRY